MRVWGWAAAAALAIAFLCMLAFQGERPQPGLGRFEPAGLLVDWPFEDILVLELSAGTRNRSFHRAGSSWRGEDGDASSDLQQSIAAGLKLLRNSAPQRIFSAHEIGERTLVDFGLEPPLHTLTARAVEGRSITIHFGGTNPLGLARYTRIDGRPEVILLPGFVAEAWERVMVTR